MLRKIYVNAVRLLADLTRIGAVAFPSASRRPAIRAPHGGAEGHRRRRDGLLLAGVRLMRGFWAAIC